MYDAQWRDWFPYVSPNDPCPPIRVKWYVVPPNQFIVIQPPNLPQFPLEEALMRGTLWPALYSSYPTKRGVKGGGKANGGA
ncbi:spore coat associated protein CotJA [Cohnella suwonensis]|uniref:Spore coat associated protein CotJA n=1 Tax=Cohnella suwonensis TaxID=696072 RepID=A0ABW0LR51_9BACL